MARDRSGNFRRWWSVGAGLVAVLVSAATETCTLGNTSAVAVPGGQPFSEATRFFIVIGGAGLAVGLCAWMAAAALGLVWQARLAYGIVWLATTSAVAAANVVLAEKNAALHLLQTLPLAGAIGGFLTAVLVMRTPTGQQRLLMTLRWAAGFAVVAVIAGFALYLGTGAMADVFEAVGLGGGTGGTAGRFLGGALCGYVAARIGGTPLLSPLPPPVPVEALLHR